MNWDDVSKLKSRGGLGVKDLKLIKIGLLAKRKLRLLVRDSGLWRELNKETYLSLSLVVVGPKVSILPHPGGKRFPVSGLKRKVVQIGILMTLQGKWGRVFKLPFGRILGLGASS